VGLLFATAFGIAAVAAASEEGESKVVICHIPPHCPDEAHTIEVGAPAVPAHLGHGDYEGPCNPQVEPAQSLSSDNGCEDCNEDGDADSDDGESDYDAEDDSDDDADSDRCKAGHDECAAYEDDCAVDAICVDLPHGYDCECKPGYEGDGWACTPVDPACTTNADCASGETCYPDGTCGVVPDGCSANDQCPPGSVCNVGTGECQGQGGPCGSDAECGIGERCFLKSGWCGPAGDPCTTDADCKDGQLCHTPTKTCQTPNGTCEVVGDCTDPCRENYECRDNQCIGVPVCHPLCSRCDEGQCSNLCANPYETSTDNVNIIDCLFSLRATVELEECPVCICDVNSDRQVTVTDTLKILRWLVQLPENLICPDPTTVPIPEP
jgi:hypothetical protein